MGPPTSTQHTTPTLVSPDLQFPGHAFLSILSQALPFVPRPYIYSGLGGPTTPPPGYPKSHSLCHISKEVETFSGHTLAFEVCGMCRSNGILRSSGSTFLLRVSCGPRIFFFNSRFCGQTDPNAPPPRKNLPGSAPS